MTDRIILIEGIGNLLESKMNVLLLKEIGIRLQKNPDKASQQYFYSKDNKPVCLSEVEMSKIFEIFNQNFSSEGLGCCVEGSCVYFGIAHLSTSGLKQVIINLEHKQILNTEERVYTLSEKIYAENLLFKNNAKITVILFDGGEISGRLTNHFVNTMPYQVTITMLTEDGEKVIDLKSVKDLY
jgi:hypothetical protein